MDRWRGLLLLALVQCVSVAAQEKCDDAKATFVPIEGPKVVKTALHKEGQHKAVWSFDPPPGDLQIAVTPTEKNMDPDVTMYARTPKKSTPCRFTYRAQDYGGDMVIVKRNVTELFNITRYYLHIYCHTKNCDYHIAFSRGGGDSEREEIKIGDTKTGIAYRGVPLHFFFDCKDQCAEEAVQGTNRRLTFSVWPRDATSVHHLTLLVRKDAEPTTASTEHLKATRGWYSGEVVGTVAEAGRYYITVLKRHGKGFMAFEMSVRYPETVQKMPLNKPLFGAVGRNGMAFYTFKVDEPNTDIEVYVTKLDGDPDMSLSHGAVHSHPTPLSAQWHSRKVGDDELVITPSDPKRKAHPTGWFVVGVHGYKNTAFSIIALVEPHIDPEDAKKQPGQVLDWTEVWLGLPQTMAAGPGRPSNFIFFSQMKAPKLFVQVQTLDGKRPDACMSTCGSDPHGCPYVSPFASPATVASSPRGAVSPCSAAKIQGGNGDTQATITEPCSLCWYSLLITSEGASNRTRYRLLLGADGRAHPLIAGEAFRGHVDANDVAVLLVYDMSEGELKNRTKANSTLRIVMTTIYGDPMFAVRSATEDGPQLFASNVTGRDHFSLAFQPGEDKTKAKTYYIVVWANSKHAQFRMQVSWDINATIAASIGGGGSQDDLKGIGLPVLYEGKAASSVVEGIVPRVFLYRPVAGALKRPNIRISMRAQGEHGLRMYVMPVKTGSDHSIGTVRSALASAQTAVMQNALSAGWISARGSAVLTIASSDPRYLDPGSGDIYAICVIRLKPSNTTASFVIEVSKEGGIQELLATGVPVPGVVRAGEYSRYRITVAESGRHLAVVLKAISGDADLYLGFDANVSRGKSIANSTLYGSDSIFLPAFGPLNSLHCSHEVMQKKGECVYFAAVLGSSRYSEYEISAVVPQGAPVTLGPGKDVMLFLPPAGYQYLLLPLEPGGTNMTLQVQLYKGELASVNIKVVSRAKAKHPDQQLTALSAATADLRGTEFAGVWSVRLEPETLAPLCKAAEDSSGCAAFVSLRARSGFFGEATLLVGSKRSPEKSQEGSSTAPQLKGALLMLQAGMPSRGSLRSKSDVLCFGFRVQDPNADLTVMLTPLTNCTPILQLEFPHEDSGSDQRTIVTLQMDKRLGFVSTRVPHTESRFRVGLYYLWVRQLVSTQCEFDLRAQVEATSSVADFGAMGSAAPATLLPNSPVYVSDDTERYFLFTSQIMKAEFAAQREQMEVRVTALSGDIQVAVAVLNASKSKNASKEDLLAGAFGDIRPVAAQSSAGANRFFVCRVHERCGAALACQLLLRVRSLRPGRFADYLAVATDTSQGLERKAEVLLPGVPVRGCVGTGCPGGRVGSVQYQLLINNPSAKLRVWLSCQGADRDVQCGQVLLSADARPTLPEKMEERTYTPLPSDATGELELAVSAVSGDIPGQCHVPCVLLVRVELKPGSTGAANYTLSAATRGGYTLLADGGDPVTALARPSRPKYFLFDSRRKSPLLTLAVKVPYDSYDPNMELVSMYVLDCDIYSAGNSSRGVRPANLKKLQDPQARPSAENYRFRALPSSRGQLVAFVTRGPSKTSQIDEGRHCYYRIAVISNRLRPVKFTIRGFDWHPGAPLLLGEPLEGMVDRKHTFSYQLEGSVKTPPSEGMPKVVLSLEVCSGKVVLRTSARRPESGGGSGAGEARPFLKAEGGLPPTTLPLEENRWLEISARRGRFSSYVLTAEDPSKRVWLQPKRSTLIVTQDGPRFKLAWSPAFLFGAGHPEDGTSGDSHPAAVYEVFYGRAGVSLANASTACGLYFDYRYKRTKRIFTKTKRTATISGLKPGHNYVFNVVARSSKTGHSVAYEPYRQFVFPEEGMKQLGETENLVGRGFWGEAAPVLLIGIALGVVFFARPCCKGGRPSWRRFELELPSWGGRSARRYDAAYSFDGSGSGAGSYTAPSVVGQAHYSQIR